MSKPQRIWASEIASGYPTGDPQLNPEYVLYADAKRWRDESVAEARADALDEAYEAINALIKKEE